MSNPDLYPGQTHKQNTTAASTMSPVSKDLSSLPRETKKGGGGCLFQTCCERGKRKEKTCVCVGGGWVGGL